MVVTSCVYLEAFLASRDRTLCPVSARCRRAIVRRAIQKLYGSAKDMLAMFASVPSSQLWAMSSMRV